MISPLATTTQNRLSSNDGKVATANTDNADDEECSSSSDENDGASARKSCTKPRTRSTVEATPNPSNNAAKPDVAKTSDTHDVMIMALVLIVVIYVLKVMVFVLLRTNHCSKQRMMKKKNLKQNIAKHADTTRNQVEGDKKSGNISDPLPAVAAVEVYTERSSSTLGSSARISVSCSLERVAVGGNRNVAAEVSGINVTKHKSVTVGNTSAADEPSQEEKGEKIVFSGETPENHPMPNGQELRTTNFNNSVACGTDGDSHDENNDYENDSVPNARTAFPRNTTGNNRDSVDTGLQAKHYKTAAPAVAQATTASVVQSKTKQNDLVSSLATVQNEQQYTTAMTHSVGFTAQRLLVQEQRIKSGPDLETDLEIESEIESNRLGRKRLSINTNCSEKKGDSDCSTATRAPQSFLTARTRAMSEDNSKTTRDFTGIIRERETTQGLGSQVAELTSFGDATLKNKNTSNVIDTSDGTMRKNRSKEDLRQNLDADCTQCTDNKSSDNEKIEQRPRRPPSTSGPKLHQATLAAIQSCLQDGSALEEALDEEGLVCFAAKMNRNTVNRIHNKVRGIMVVDYEQAHLKGTNTKYDYLYNRIHSQEEFLAVASEFFRTVMSHTRNGTCSSTNSTSSRTTLNWVKNASGMHRQAKIHAEDPEDDFYEDIDMDSSKDEVITPKGEVLATSRRSNRVRVMTTKKKLKKRELKNFRILAEAVKELEYEQRQSQYNEQQQVARKVKKDKRNDSKIRIPSKLASESAASKPTGARDWRYCRVDRCQKWARRQGLCMRHGKLLEISDVEEHGIRTRGVKEAEEDPVSNDQKKDVVNTKEHQKTKNASLTQLTETTEQNSQQQLAPSKKVNGMMLPPVPKQIHTKGIIPVTGSEFATSHIRPIHVETQEVSVLSKRNLDDTDRPMEEQSKEEKKKASLVDKSVVASNSNHLPKPQSTPVPREIQHNGTDQPLKKHIRDESNKASVVDKVVDNSMVASNSNYLPKPQAPLLPSKRKLDGVDMPSNNPSSDERNKANVVDKVVENSMVALNSNYLPKPQVSLLYSKRKMFPTEFANEENSTETRSPELPYATRNRQSVYSSVKHGGSIPQQARNSNETDASSATKRQKTLTSADGPTLKSLQVAPLMESKWTNNTTELPAGATAGTVTMKTKAVVFHSERLGLKINADGKHVEILALLSPEHEGKIAVGDLMISVGGRNVERMRKEEIAMAIANTARPTTIQFLSAVT